MFFCPGSWDSHTFPTGLPFFPSRCKDDSEALIQSLPESLVLIFWAVCRQQWDWVFSIVCSRATSVFSLAHCYPAPIFCSRISSIKPGSTQMSCHWVAQDCTVDPTAPCHVFWGGGDKTKAYTSVILIATGLTFLVQALVFISVGSLADYGNWNPWVVRGFSILCYAFEFGFLGVKTADKWRAAMALYILSSECPHDFHF